MRGWGDAREDQKPETCSFWLKLSHIPEPVYKLQGVVVEEVISEPVGTGYDWSIRPASLTHHDALSVREPVEANILVVCR